MTCHGYSSFNIIYQTKNTQTSLNIIHSFFYWYKTKRGYRWRQKSSEANIIIRTQNLTKILFARMSLRTLRSTSAFCSLQPYCWGSAAAQAGPIFTRQTLTQQHLFVPSTDPSTTGESQRGTEQPRAALRNPRTGGESWKQQRHKWTHAAKSPWLIWRRAQSQKRNSRRLLQA